MAEVNITSLAVIVPQIFKNVDFNGLNDAIQQLANNNKKLDVEEKKVAVGVIEDWQQSVVKRLNERAQDMSDFIRFFDPNARTGYSGYYRSTSNQVVNEDMQEDLATQTETVEQYQDYQNALAALRQHNQNRPVQPVKRLNATVEETFKEQKDYELACHIYDIESGRLGRLVNTTEKTWKSLLLEKQSVQDALKKARSFNRNLGKLIRDCEDKTQAAKLCVSIANKEVREAIKSLLEFTKDI